MWPYQIWMSYDLENFTVAIMTCLPVLEYLCHKWPRTSVPCVEITIPSFPISWLISSFVTRVSRQVLLVKQELVTFPEHLSSSPVFCGVVVVHSLVFWVVFCRSLFSPVNTIFMTYMYIHLLYMYNLNCMELPILLDMLKYYTSHFYLHSLSFSL